MNRFFAASNRFAIPEHSAATRPVGFMLQEVFRMGRAEMIRELLVLSDQCSFDFTPRSLNGMSNSKLRCLLVAARQHYQKKAH